MPLADSVLTVRVDETSECLLAACSRWKREAHCMLVFVRFLTA